MGVKLLTTNGHETYFGNDGSPYMRTKNSSPRTETVMAHLLHASKGGQWGSRPDAELLADDGSAIVMRVNYSDGTRTDVFINYAGTTSFKTVGGLRTDAKLAVVERFSSGKVKKVLIYGGTAVYEDSGAQLLADGLERDNAYDIDQTNQNALKIEFGLVR
jgi:hypothetical protein